MMNCLRPQTEHVQDNAQTGNNCQVCFRLRVRRRCLDQIPVFELSCICCMIANFKTPVCQ